MLFANYEELTDPDAWLIERYHDPTQTEFHPTPESLHRVWAPTSLIPKVDRAYFRLAQDNTIAAWFEANGFDISKPTISKEEFEKRFANCFGKPAAGPKISNAMIDDHVRRYFESTLRPTVDGCEKAWEVQHGSTARERVRIKYRAHAKKHGITVKEGRPQKLAK
jgi:hypothetical protein